MDDQVSFRQWLREHRKEYGYTQEELAQQVPCSSVTVSRIEEGVLRPSRQLAELLVAVLEVPAAARTALVRRARTDPLKPSKTTPAHPPEHPGEDTRQLPVRPAHNLPWPVTPIVGREAELAATGSMLRGPNLRLLTLTGPPGVGKTRLAIALAHRHVGLYSDGIWLVDLSPLRDPGLVIPSIAHLLGLSELGDRPIADVLQHYLQEKSLLLVLDNFEQVVEAAEEVSHLLVHCPRLTVLVTSRMPLRVEGEQEYAVSPLQAPSRRELDALRQPANPAQSLAEYEAVRLFVERARAVRPGFELRSTNARAVGEICNRLDGLPLAIELAAARVVVMSPQKMLELLEHGLRLLTGGARNLPARHHTLWAAIDWSYNLLAGEEQRFFRRMAIFNGGRTFDALEAICNSETLHVEVQTGVELDAPDRVESLLEKSLLQEREGRNGELRFWMLETIHEYAREKLQESGEVRALAGKHAAYFLALAEQAEPNLLSAEQGEWLDRLEDEHDNLRTVLRWAVEEASNTGERSSEERCEALEVGLRIAAAIGRFWYTKGYYNEGREWIAKLLSLASESGGPAVGGVAGGNRETMSRAKAKALRTAGWLAHSQGDHQGAYSLLNESLALNRQLGNKVGTADCLIAIGTVALSVEDFHAARSAHEESLALSRETGYRWGIARSLLCLGNIDWCEGNHQRARSLYEQGLAMARETGDESGVTVLLYSLAGLALTEGDYQRARLLYEQSLAISRKIGFKSSTVIALRNLGSVALIAGDYQRALSLYEESLLNCREIGDRPGAAAVLEGLGGVAAMCGHAERGARLLGAAEALMQATDHLLWADERVVYDHALAAIRRQLGEEEFERARVAGRAMSEDEAIEYALRDSGGSRPYV